MDQIWKVIQPCITAYMLIESYEKLNKNRLDKFSDFYQNNNIQTSKETWKANDYIQLEKIGSSTLSAIYLVYHIEKESLFVIKAPHTIDNDIPNLYKREQDNYSNLNYPLLPAYYGTVETSGIYYLIIEYIQGETLQDYLENENNATDIITIIFELILTIQYLHKNNFVYRDYKTTNVIIDQNKNAVLIDFDRMLNKSNMSEDEEHTKYLSSYCLPEEELGQVSIESDIFLFGKMISEILDKGLPKNERKQNFEEILKKCSSKIKEERPTINELFFEFYTCYHSLIKESLIKSNSQIHFELGMIYMDGQYIAIDIDKAIQYFSFAANKNHMQAQYNLAYIYLNDELNHINIDKAIDYLTLAADQKCVQSQYLLGAIYTEGKLVPQNIDKAIYYLTLAANQNHSEALFCLGFIYKNGIKVQRDIKKAIQCYLLSSDLHNANAQNNLGNLYEEGEYVTRKIDKAIHFYSLAAEQNHAQALYNLGFIYSSGQHVPKDIGKGIHYYTLAANQNHDEAQYELGIIYLNGVDIQQDIDKAINYLELAAKQNHSQAQHYLGTIYENDKYSLKDINKSI